MNPDEIQEFVSQHDVKMIDLKFTDLLGTWQHFSITPRELTPEIYTQGIGFDGSSIRAFQGDALHSESVFALDSSSILWCTGRWRLGVVSLDPRARGRLASTEHLRLGSPRCRGRL